MYTQVCEMRANSLIVDFPVKFQTNQDKTVIKTQKHQEISMPNYKEWFHM